jgi:His-Xaa-Ser repeat protein HxsA
MNKKLTIITGVIAAAAFIALPESSEARPHHGSHYSSHRSSSGLSITFSTGNRGYSGHRYAPVRRSYCPPVRRSFVRSYYRPVRYVAPTRRYVQAPAVRVSVADVQYTLKRRGYNIGRVDGVYGRNTSNAIKRFQRDVGLHPCGTLTPATLRALGL